MAGRGRKPKSDAIRRAHESTQAVVVDPSLLEMPEVVAGNDLMRECWEWTTEGATHFTQADVPMLTLLAYWWAVAQQCTANLTTDTGVITEIFNPMTGTKQAPDIKTLQLATNQLRQLSAELGVGPLARTRMGLMKMATASMAADLPGKIFKMLDEHHGN